MPDVGGIFDVPEVFAAVAVLVGRLRESNTRLVSRCSGTGSLWLPRESWEDESN